MKQLIHSSYVCIHKVGVEHTWQKHRRIPLLGNTIQHMQYLAILSLNDRPTGIYMKLNYGYAFHIITRSNTHLFITTIIIYIKKYKHHLHMTWSNFLVHVSATSYLCSISHKYLTNNTAEIHQKWLQWWHLSLWNNAYNHLLWHVTHFHFPYKWDIHNIEFFL